MTILVAISLIALGLLAGAHNAAADVTTIDRQATRDGWDPSEPNLSPAAVSNGTFGQVFNTAVTGEVYAQPLVAGSTVVVATEHDMVYGVNATTGAIQWTTQVGTSEPSASIFAGFDDITPEVGITSTPVMDVSANVVYVMARTWDGSNPASARWFLHALNLSTGAEVPGWPVQIMGTASNDPSSIFDPTVESQRTGLLLSNGWVYAAYASYGDLGQYKGWITGVSTTTGAVTLWTDETGANLHGGIWQSGAGIMQDANGGLYVATGNGAAPPPGPASASTTTYGQSLIRLTQHADGTLTPADYFTPYNATSLNSQDLDLGSGGPVALPDSMGVSGHPHLLFVASKAGALYLLDRDNLGGEAQGPNGTDASVAQTAPSPSLGFGHGAVWPGDGGYIYDCIGLLNAYRITNSGGTVSISQVGTAGGSYRSVSPSVTSNGTTSGSALVWMIAQPLDGTSPAQLQAYGAVPVNGQMPLLFSSPVGIATKFSVPTLSGGRAYVGTYDGHLIGFGPTPYWHVVATQAGGSTSQLKSVSAVASNDVWAVGSYNDARQVTWPLAEHWNGTSWTNSVPLAGGTTSALSGVSAIATNDVWAVGSYNEKKGITWPLTEHWNGTAWSVVLPPRGGTTSTLTSAAGVAGNDVWTVGSYNDSSGATWPLTEHWNGTAWSVVVPPKGGSSSTFTGVSAIASNDVWAVGSYKDSTGISWPLTEHWNGTAWSVLVPPQGGTTSTFTGVSATATNDVWAVGSYKDSSGVSWPLTEHWNGTAWSVVLPPAAGASSTFNAVSAIAPNDAWAVGSYKDSGGVSWPLTEHWNGIGWAVVGSPRGGTSSVLYGATRVTSSDAWSVGTYTDAANVQWPLAEHLSF